MVAVQQPAGQNGQQFGQQFGQQYGQRAAMTMPPPQATMNYVMAPQQQMPQQQMPQQQQQQGMQPPMQYGGPVHQQYGQF
jgi:hypothetical protein